MSTLAKYVRTLSPPQSWYHLSRAPQKSRPPAPDLPVETILQILDHSAAEMLTLYDRLTFLGLAAIDDSQKAWMTHIGTARLTLCNAALVGRSWCAAANELLYSHVILLNHHQIRLFSRTLRRSHPLGRIVKELSILLALDILGSGPSYRTVRESNYHSLLERNTETRKDVSHILHHLPTLDTVSLRFQDPLNIALGYGSLFDSAGIASRFLRRLIVHGYSLCNSLPGTTFPSLEVLCLHGVIIRSTFTFPYLPQLHTLQICQTENWSEHLGDIIPHHKLPVLRTLQLYNNKFSDEIFCRKARHSFPLLRCLHLIGTFEVRCFGTLAEIGALEYLQHFAIGNIEGQGFAGEHPFHSWRFPKSLETLTVLEDVRSKTSQSGLALTSCMKLNLEAQKKGTISVRRVRYYGYAGTLDEPVSDTKAFDAYSVVHRHVNGDKWLLFNLHYPPDTTP